MAEQPLAGRNALVLGVERPDGRAAAVALAEAGADVAVATLSEDTAAEFAANSTANEFWAIGRKGLVLTTDGRETTVREAIADATADLGPISILACHADAPLPREALSGLRSDPAIVVILSSEAAPDDARALLGWVRQLADTGLHANAVLTSKQVTQQVGPALKQHHPPTPLGVGSSVVYLASDATAAIEGAFIVAA